MLLVKGREEILICLQFLQYCCNTLLYIYGLSVVLLVQGSGEMAFLPAVTSGLLYHNCMNISTNIFLLV